MVDVVHHKHGKSINYTSKKHGLDVLHIKWHNTEDQSQRLGDNGDLGNQCAIYLIFDVQLICTF